MFIEFVHLSGAHKGDRQRFTLAPPSAQRDGSPDDAPAVPVVNNVISIGRHSSNDVAFDIRQDLVVSSHHAQVTVEGTKFVLTDLDSKNGTFVNGKSITRHIVRNDDVIEIGKGGPQLRCKLAAEESPLEKTVLASALRDPGKTTPAGRTTIRELIGEMLSDVKSGKGASLTNASVYVRQAVTQMMGKNSRQLRTAIVVGSALLILGLGGLLLQNMMLRRELERTSNHQRNELLTLEAQFQEELEASQQRVKVLQRQIDDANAGEAVSSAQLKSLEELLASERQKTSALGTVIRATRDSISSLGTMTKEALLSLGSFQQIAKVNAESIFMICGLDTQDGEVIPIGSGFAVREDGVILTNAHVAVELQRLRNQYGDRYSGIVIQNENSARRFPVTSMGIHKQYNPATDYSPDVAWLKVGTKNVPLKAVALASPEECQRIDKGYEVAVIGFPGLTMNPDNPVATFSRGAIGRIIKTQYIQHDCQTSGGNSGSPIFGRNGSVVAIHYGGQGNLSVLVQLDVPDSAGGTKQVLMTRRIKEAVGLNEAVRADVIGEFVKSVN